MVNPIVVTALLLTSTILGYNFLVLLLLFNCMNSEKFLFHCQLLYYT